jgi:hypothetical protein
MATTRASTTAPVTTTPEMTTPGMTTPTVVKAPAVTPAASAGQATLEAPSTPSQPTITPAAGPTAVHISTPAAPPPEPTVVTVPVAPALQIAATATGTKIGRGVAVRPRLRFPTHIGGVFAVITPPAIVTPDFVAADVRRPLLGMTPSVGSRSRLVTASVALLMLLAVSGSFLLLAHRIQGCARPGTS